MQDDNARDNIEKFKRFKSAEEIDYTTDVIFRAIHTLNSELKDARERIAALEKYRDEQIKAHGYIAGCQTIATSSKGN